ncbi:primary-amine oxidase [Micromonospora sp. CPCC 205539]|uniref:copper amine oxidase n=1 Tax=Micromonospora sp. CPCC 205539 TaxID=3122408 RepID=UPI002FF2EC46
MLPPRSVPAAATAALLLASAGTLLFGSSTNGRAADPAPDCGTSGLVRETLPNGTRWQLCWHVDAKTGLVLEQVAVRARGATAPVRVLGSITMAQLNVPYDSGTNEWNDITSYGFGGDRMQTLTGEDCRGGSRRPAATGAGPAGNRVLCVSEERSGPAFRLNDEATAETFSEQGDDLVLRTYSKVGWYEYVNEYRLSDDGVISVGLGATGDLSPYDFSGPTDGWPVGVGESDHASSHHHSAFWRVDFDLDGQGGEGVEQYDTAPTGDRGRRSAILATTRTPVATEATATVANRRWWRVASPTSLNADGHPRSYELALTGGDSYEAHPETIPDVTFTQYRECEKFATFNTDPECQARTILDYTNGEALTDPVLWVRVGYHHVPRDEDQSPMPVHWQGFQLVPRDMFATNPIGPSARATINGRP